MRLWPLLLLVLAALAPTASAEGTGTIHVTVCIDVPEDRYMPDEECWMDTVEYAAVEARGAQVHHTTADFDGVAIFPDVAAGQYTLSSDAAGFTVEDRVVDVKAGQRTYVVLKASSQQVSVQGELVDDAFAPIAGAQLHFYGYSGTWNVTTDNKGTFAATVHSGYHYLEMEIPGFNRGYASIFVDGSPLQLMALRDDDQATMTGQALDQHGQPVPGAQINGWSDGAANMYRSWEPEVRDGYTVISDPYQRGDFYATADNEGHFVLALHPGFAHLSAWADGYREGWQDFEAADGDHIEVVLHKLPDKDARVVGTVVDAETGAAIENFEVNVQNVVFHEWACSMPASRMVEDHGRYRHPCDISTSPGRFEGAVMPGYSTIEVWARGDCAYSCMDTYIRHIQTIVLEPGQNTFEIELHRKPAPDAAVNGYVLDENGEPVEHASINFHSDGSYGSARVDEFGSYRVMLRSGWHQVSVWAPGFYHWEGMVQTVAGKEVPFDIHLSPNPVDNGMHWRHGPYPTPMAPPRMVHGMTWDEPAMAWDEPAMVRSYNGTMDVETEEGEDFVDLGGLQEGYNAAERKERSLAEEADISTTEDGRIPAVPLGLLVIGLMVLARRRP